MDPVKVASYVTAAVTVASILANFVPPHTWVGKGLHWIALNIRVTPPAPPSNG